MAKQREEITNFYDNVLYAATHGEEALVQSMSLLIAALHILHASNEIIHHMRKCAGTVSFPMRLNTDLRSMQLRVNQLQKKSRNNKVVMRNFDDLASAARKVA